MMTEGRSKLLDDLAQLASNAMGVADGARKEAEVAFRSSLDRWLASAQLVTREEFEAVRGMAERARQENERLERRLAELEERLRGDA